MARQPQRPPRNKPAQPAGRKRSSDFLTQYEPPRWDWQSSVWLGFFVLAAGVVVLGFVYQSKTGDPGFILLAVLLWGLGGGFWLWWRRERKRTAAIARFALNNGFAFKSRAKGDELKELPPLPLFERGKKRKAKNLMAGHLDDLPFVFMDYTYLLEFGMKSAGALADLAGIKAEVPDEGNHPVTQTVVVFPSLPKPLPNFRLIPRGFMQKTLDRLFEGSRHLHVGENLNKEFASHYLVEGASVNEVGRVFTPRVLDYFAANPTWYVESFDSRLAVFRAGQRCTPRKCQARLDKSLEILQTLTKTQQPRSAGKGV
jgi:hypothetical protein